MTQMTYQKMIEKHRGRLVAGYRYGQAPAAEMDRQAICSYDKDFTYGPTIGYKYVDGEYAHECLQMPYCNSKNYQYDRPENGVSMASVGGCECKSFAIMGYIERDIPKYYYVGEMLDFGDDDEITLNPETLLQITEAEYLSLIGNADNRLIKQDMEALQN